ncbi:MAG TPA: CHAT domain-containing protein [Thermoanaerobaculia bacterium]|nr:CHAT domain-containing protein [Thermoanaerobaculia bacterium]
MPILSTPSRTIARVVRVAPLLLVLAASPLWADAPKDVAQRFLTLAYEERFADLPKTQSADTAEFERRLRNTFRVRCVSIEEMSLTPRDGGETESVFDARLHLWKTDRDDPNVAGIDDTIVLRLHLVRQESSWLISRVVNVDEEFAARLLSVPAADRGRLIEDHPASPTKGLARALYAGGLRLLNEGKFNEAGPVFVLAREIAARVGDRGGEAMAVAASIYTPKRAGPVEAVIAQSFILAEDLRDPDVLARLWYDRGRAKFAKYWAAREDREIAERLEWFQTASVYAERAEDRTILVRVLYSMANLTANNHADYITARRYIDRSLAVAREIGDRTGEMGAETILTTIYGQQGDADRTIFHHTRALELARELGAFAYPTLLLRSGVELTAAGRFKEARAAFDSILVRRGNTFTTKSGRAYRPALGEALRSVAAVEAAEGNLAEAACLIREAATYYDSAPEAYLYELAPRYMERGDPATALAFSLASLSEQRLFSTQKVEALLAAGRAYGALGMPDRGLASAVEAIALREEIDGRVAGDERQRAKASRPLADSYELAAQLLIDRGRISEAFAFLENGRARVLTEVIEHGGPSSLAEVDFDLDREQARLERELVAISADLDRARARGRAVAVPALQKRLEQARAAHASFVDGRLARAARRNSTHRRVDAETIGQLAARLPRGVVAVEFLLLPRQLHFFVIRGDGARIRHRVVTVDQSTVEARIRTFLDMLSARDLKVSRPARQLYDLVIAPVEADLSNATGVLLIPDKILWRLPFAALVDGGGRHFIERMPIAYAPSLGAYAAMRDERRSVATRDTSLLAIGNPTLFERAKAEATNFYRGVTLGSLPDAEREVDAVARLYRKPVVLKGNDATEARTKSLLGHAAVIHFATHGIVDDGNAMYSRLALSTGRSREEDGWLESWEIARMQLNADIVVLSACETAVGAVYTGEGAVGMTWSFFLAGARSAVASQWKVASGSTAGLMIRFHGTLRNAAARSSFEKAEALRSAQLALLRQPSTAHPFHWAAFVLIGDTGGTARNR